MTETIKGTLAALIRYPEKGAPGIPLDQALLLEGRGLEGDCHASGGDRQLSILPVEARLWMAAREAPGLCFSRFRENLSLRGIPPELLLPGTRLRAGETVLEISARHTRCEGGCLLFSLPGGCPLRGQKFFAQVIRGGLVKTGDEVYVL